MISALLICAHERAGSGQEARALTHLAKSLAALVPAVVAGSIGQAMVVAVGDSAAKDDALTHLCEEAGCALVCADTLSVGLARVLVLMRHEAVLALKSGVLLDAVAMEALERYCLTHAPKHTPALRIYAQPQSWWQQFGVEQEAVGVVLGKSALQNLAKQKNLTLPKLLHIKPANRLKAKVAVLSNAS